MRNIKHLNFGWQYKADFNTDYIASSFDDGLFETVSIPHTNKILPYNNFDEKIYQFESCYRKTVHVESALKNKQAILHFEGVMTYVKVFVNEQLVVEHKGGYTPFKANITQFLEYDCDNVIVVYVDSSERNEIPPFGFVVDYLTYGGIYREVRLEFSNSTIIENCHVRTRDVLKKNKQIDLDLYLDNYAFDTSDMELEFILEGSEQQEVCRFTKQISLNGELHQNITLQQTVSNVQLWDIDTPNLYSLKVALSCEKTKIDNQSFRFGFREVRFTENGFFLNGKSIKLRGLNRHQSFPYVGYAMPKSAQYKDADILKHDLGLNTVRLSHYPQSNHFLDRCDELGLLVFDEIPGWQHVSEQDEWRTITCQHVTEMIKKDWNHPSIFIWGVRINESEDCDELYRETNRIARSLDDTRPTGGVRCIQNSNLLEDVYTFNDFVHSGSNHALDKPKDVIGHKAPYLVTEHNGHMYPTKRFDPQSQRLEHAIRHLNVLDATYGDQNIGGAIGWCMFDYNTHKDFGSGDRICYHGVLDMYRLPKYAAAAYTSQQSERPFMEIASNMQMGDYPGGDLGHVYVLTNCDSIKLYKNDLYIQTFFPDNNQFPNLPHPPIIIDNYIGNQIEENEPFSSSDCRMLKQILIKITEVGLEKLPLMFKLKMLFLLKKNRMTIQAGIELYEKYVGGWGDAATTYRIEGYINGQLVCEQSKGQSFVHHLDVQADANELTEDETWDTTRITIERRDEDDSVLSYASDALRIEAEGAVEVIGPDTISLIGGGIAFWVRTNGRSGKGIVRVISSEFGVIEKEIQVIKK